MNEPQPVAVENFSHVCIGVSDMEKSLAFYTAVLGMDVVSMWNSPEPDSMP